MNTRRPPRMATWLLERLGNSKLNESLIGDLHEQYAQGRTHAWYWHQVIRALFISFVKAVRVHGVSCVGAIALGYVVTLVWLRANALFLKKLGSVHRTFVEIGADRDLAMYLSWSLEIAIKAMFFFIAGWIAVRVHRSHPRTVIALLLLVLHMFPAVWRQLVVDLDPSLHRSIILFSHYGCVILGAFLATRASGARRQRV